MPKHKNHMMSGKEMGKMMKNHPKKEMMEEGKAAKKVGKMMKKLKK